MENPDAHRLGVRTKRIWQVDSAMTIARRQLIDVSVTLWYRRMSRCVRGVLWLGGDSNMSPNPSFSKSR
jgi:hypothetical protein